MTADLTKLSKAARAEVERWCSYASARKERMDATVSVTAAVLRQAVGVDQAERFFREHVNTLDDTKCRFLGPDGIERSRLDTADQIYVGWALGPKGATWGIKATSGDNAVVLALDPAQMVNLIVEAVEALAMYKDAEGSIYNQVGGTAASAYDEMLGHLAGQHLALAGKTASIYRQARYEAQLQVHSHAKAAEDIATEKAMKTVEGLVRKLSQAAAMPAGLERSLMLEEAQPMIKKAFGG